MIPSSNSLFRERDAPSSGRRFPARAMSGTELSRVRTEFQLRPPEPIKQSLLESSGPTFLCNQVPYQFGRSLWNLIRMGRSFSCCQPCSGHSSLRGNCFAPGTGLAMSFAPHFGHFIVVEPSLQNASPWNLNFRPGNPTRIGVDE